ncbi:putative RNA-directed DNA polymerase [Tanacetum coccineum]
MVCISEYYHKLNSLWREFDMLTKFSPCTCNARTESGKHQQLMKLMQFLMGLDDVYQPTRSSLLTQPELPDVKDAFVIVCREESHRGLGSTSGVLKPQVSSFVAKTGDNFKGQNRNNNNFNNQNATNRNQSNNYNNNNNGTNRTQYNSLSCQNCGMKGHTIDRCFEIIGYPPGFKKNPNGNFGNNNKRGFSNNNNRGGSSNNVEVQTQNGPLPFTTDQISKLMSLIGEKENSGVHANMAGISFSFFNANVFLNSHFHKFFNANIKVNGVNFNFGWIIDSGANQHITNSTKNMTNVIDISDLNINVGHPNRTIAKINHVGNLKLTNNVVLFDVLVIPEYTVSLLSVNKMIKDSKLHVGFNEYDCVIQDLKKETVLGTGSESGGLYVFDIDCKLPRVKSNFSILCCHVSKCVWHKRLGHPSDQVLKVLKSSLKITKPDHNDPCDICHFSKQTREPFPLSDHTSESLGDLIHLDLWGPYRITSREGYRYFLTIVDDFSRAVWVYLIKSKDEVFGYFVEFVNLIANQFLKRIKVIRSDNGTEFINNKMEKILKEKGIIHQTSCAYTPQQNGIAERKHRHLLNVARSLLFQGNIPLCFWTDCILTATYLINRLPSSVLAGRSPFCMLYGREPSLSHLRCFGCLCFSSVLNNSDKFSPKSEKCILIGYSSSKKAYKLLSLENRSYIFSRDVKFYETIFPYKMKSNNKTFELNNEVNSRNFFDLFESSHQDISSPNDDGEGPSDDAGEVIVDHQSIDTAEEQPFDNDDHTASSIDDNPISEGNGPNTQHIPTFDISNRTDDDTSVCVNTRRSGRVSKLPDKLNDFVLDNKVKYGLNRYANHTVLSADASCFISNLNKTVEPTCYNDAIKDINWVQAMNNEMEALYLNNTRILTDLPLNRKAIKSKWVYKIKYKSNGEVERYKARLVAKGCGQKEGVDYEEIFSPVVKMSTIRCFINMAVQKSWNIFQMDVNNAFLYGDLTEDVYMIPPPSFFDKNETRVCKLVKSLYGLKQALRQWNKKLVETLSKVGFLQSKNDHSLFTKNKDGTFLALLVYVDDIIVTGNNNDEISKIKVYLNQKFKIKDLGELKFFLGIEVVKTKNGLCLNQRKYCIELLYEYGLLGCKSVATPMPKNGILAHKETENDKPLKNVTSYQKIVGKLIYLCNTIAYTVHCLSQHMHSPLQSHFKAALRVLRYLKSAPGAGISYTKSSSSSICAYADSDWAKCKMTRRSVSGYCVFIYGCLVSWKSKKQATLSRSFYG